MTDMADERPTPRVGRDDQTWAQKKVRSSPDDPESSPVSPTGRAALRRASPKEIERVLAVREETLIPANQPLVLIAQPTRSGGTLLSQLLDGHTQLHAHPYELEFGFPEKNDWPRLDLNATPKQWFEQLREPHTVLALRGGYFKDRPARQLGMEDQSEAFPFLYSTTYQRRLFSNLLKATPPSTVREVLEAYFTSYFNAWLDNQNLYGGEKKWVVGFRSGLGSPANIDAFFGDFPDGRHVTCVREPKAWIASSKRMWDERSARTIKDYANLWVRLTRQRIEIAQRYGPSVYFFTFEQLVTDTHGTMSALAAWLGIGYEPALLLPTFNRFPIKANSSFRVPGHGVITEPLKNWQTVLSDEDAGMVDRLTREIYDEACELANLQRT